MSPARNVFRYMVMCLVISGVLMGMAATALANINLVLVPRQGFGTYTESGGCQDILVDLFAKSDSAVDQNLNTVSVILNWDTTKLEFVGETNCTGSCPWLADGFFPDPDSINSDLDDGDAYYNALGPPGSSIPASPAGLLVTTFVFKARGSTNSTAISMPAFQATSAQTGVFDASANDVTGDISSMPALGIAEVCDCAVGDFDRDGLYTLADIDAAVEVYLGNDITPEHITAADVNCDDKADGLDIQPLIALILLAL